jgi:hypothetical protein
MTRHEHVESEPIDESEYADYSQLPPAPKKPKKVEEQKPYYQKAEFEDVEEVRNHQEQIEEERPKKLSEHTDIELKAMAFDVEYQRNILTTNLDTIYQELNARMARNNK